MTQDDCCRVCVGTDRNDCHEEDDDDDEEEVDVGTASWITYLLHFIALLALEVMMLLN